MGRLEWWRWSGGEENEKQGKPCSMVVVEWRHYLHKLELEVESGRRHTLPGRNMPTVMMPAFCHLPLPAYGTGRTYPALYTILEDVTCLLLGRLPSAGRALLPSIPLEGLLTSCLATLDLYPKCKTGWEEEGHPGWRKEGGGLEKEQATWVCCGTGTGCLLLEEGRQSMEPFPFP